MVIQRINFIGCGRVGKTLATLFGQLNKALIGGLLSATYPKTLEAVQALGAGLACERIQDLPPADLYLILTKDDLIQQTCEKLIVEGSLKPGSLLVHCSGSLGSEVLKKAKEKGCSIASIHPVKSFASPEESVKTFAGTYCAFEGDEACYPQLKELFEKIGAFVFKINKENKALYHLAGILANNYLVTLYYYALQAYEAAGLDADTANKLIVMLMEDSFNNIKKAKPHAALTGPLQRGDLQTIKNHLQALSPFPEMKNLYAALGSATLALTEHSPEKNEALITLFKS